MVAAAWPGMLAVYSAGGWSVIGTLCQVPPATEYFSVNDAMPSGSLALAETVTGWLASGTTGECARSENVGPMLGVNRELTAPGVPLRAGTGRSNVRARRLK